MPILILVWSRHEVSAWVIINMWWGSALHALRCELDF